MAHDGGFFSITEGIGKWFAKVVVSGTMAFQLFAKVDEDGIQNLMVSSENKNTRQVWIIGSLNI